MIHPTRKLLPLFSAAAANLFACAAVCHSQVLFKVDFENGLNAMGANPSAPTRAAGGGYEVSQANVGEEIGLNLNSLFPAQGKNSLELGEAAVWHVAQNHITNGRLSFWILPLALPPENQPAELVWGGDIKKPHQTFSILLDHSGKIKANYSSFQNEGKFLAGVESADAIKPRQWNHVAFTWGDGGQKIYLNGKLSGGNEDKFPASFLQDLKFGGLGAYLDDIELSASAAVGTVNAPAAQWQPSSPLQQQFLAAEAAARDLIAKAPQGSDAYCRGLVIDQVIRSSWGTALQKEPSELTLDNIAWITEALAKTKPALRPGEIPVPAFDANKPLVVKDGRLLQDGQPTFLNGNYTPSPIDSEIGFNFCNALMPGPGDAMPGPLEVVNDGTALARSIDTATRENKVVDILVSLVVPPWTGELDPHAFEGGAGWFNYNVESPAVKGLFQAAADAIVPTIRGHGTTVIVNLANEPAASGFSPATTAPAWRSWLMAKHRNIATLNAAWGSSFKDFTDITGPTYIKAEAVGCSDPGGIDVPTDPRSLPQWYDWCLFNQQRYARFIREIRDNIKDNRPDILFTIKWLSNFSGWWKSIGYGLNPYDVTKLLDLAGTDTWSVYAGLDPNNYWAMWWEDPTRTNDLLKSIAPDKPIVNSEDHILRGDDATAPKLKYGTYRDVIPWQHFYTALWQQAIHGTAGAELWTYWESGKGFNLNERAKALDASSQAARDMRRYAREVTALANVKPKVGILLSSAGLAWAPKEHVEASALAYKALNLTGQPVGYMLEEMLQENALERYEVLIVPGANHISRKMNEAIENFAAAGKTVIVLGAAPSMDEYGKPLTFPSAALVWPELIPPSEESSGFDGLRPKSISSHDEITKTLQGRLSNELAKLKFAPRVELQQGEGLPFGVEWRAAEVDSKVVVNLCNFSNRVQEMAVKADGNAMVGVNLLNGNSINGSLSLQPLEVALIKVQ